MESWGNNEKQLWQNWKEWKEVHFKHKPRQHKYTSSGEYYAKSNEWCDVEEVPPPWASIFCIQFQKRSSAASVNAPASMSFVGGDRARLISARSVPRVGKTASCQRAWKSTCIFYTQQKCFFVRWLGCFFSSVFLGPRLSVELLEIQRLL